MTTKKRTDSKGRVLKTGESRERTGVINISIQI